MKEVPKYEILGYLTLDIESGHDQESQSDTLKEAKEKAKFFMSNENRILSESQDLIQRVLIRNTKTKEIVEDYLNG